MAAQPPAPGIPQGAIRSTMPALKELAF